jgi:hypothetical protein
MFNYVLKMDGEGIDSSANPIHINNFIKLYNIDPNEKITIDLIKSHGYIAFNPDIPVVSDLRKKVTQNGYILDGSNWSKHNTEVTDKTEQELNDILDALKIQSKENLREHFSVVYSESVVDSNAISWNGGIESATRIYSAIQLSELAGDSSITLFDASNQAHNLTLTEAKEVAVLINSDYSSKMAEKQSVMTAIENSTNIVELDAAIAMIGEYKFKPNSELVLL